ncbi:uncharacterized protein LOC144945910 isoform X2 [Lampetra fluviatilis]
MLKRAMDLSADDTGYYGRASSLSAAGATAGAQCEPRPSAGSAARGGPPAIGSGGPQISAEGEDESDVDVDDVERGGAPQDEEEPMVGVQEQRWPMEQNACDSDDGDDDDDDDDDGDDGGGVVVEEASRKPHLEAPSWSRELRDVVVAPFTESAGPNHGLPLDASVLDYFMLFWPDRLIDVFTQETNRYAEQKIAESGKADPLWSPTTSREMKAFFAVAIMMGIKDLPRVWCYWSGNPALRCEWVSGTMTHTRYSKVSQYLHARNNVGTPARGQRGYDPIYKVRNVVEEVRANFSRHYSPRRELSVDEGMIPFKGRLFFKQHMPAKPTKWGVKVWELCEAQTGYCLNFDIYTGRSAYGAATTADAAGDGGGACGDMASGGGGGGACGDMASGGGGDGACDGDGASGANGGRAGGGGGASDTGAYGGRVHGSGGACGDMASGGGGGDVCDGGANSGRTGGGGGAAYGGGSASGAGAFGGRAHGSDGAHGDTVSGGGTCGASGANSGRTGGGGARGAGAFCGSADGRGGAGAVSGRVVGAVSAACAGGAHCAAACVYARSAGSTHSDGPASVTARAAHQTTGAGADSSAAGATALGGGTVAAFARGAAAIAAGATRAAGGTLAGRVGGGGIGGAHDSGCGSIGGAYDGGCGGIRGAYDGGCGGGGIGDDYDGGCGGGIGGAYGGGCGGIGGAYDGGCGGIGDAYDGGCGGIGGAYDKGGGGIGDAYDGGCGGSGIGDAYDGGCGGIGDAYDGGCGGGGISDAYDGGCVGISGAHDSGGGGGIGDAYDGGCGGISGAHDSGGGGGIGDAYDGGCGGIGDAHDSGGGGIGGAAHGGLSSRPAGADDAAGGADEAADDSGVRRAAGAALAGAGGGTCGPAGADGGRLDGRAASAGSAHRLAAGASVTACGIPSNGAARCVDGTPPRGLVESSPTARGIPSSAAHRIGHGSARSAGNRVPLSVVSVAARSVGGCTSHRTGSSAAPIVGNCTAHSFINSTAHNVINSTAHSITNSTAHSVTNSTANSVTDSTAHSTSNAAPRTTRLAAVATPAPAESGGLGYRVVMSLTRSYWHRNHHLYFDRYFSSPALLEDLRSRCGTYACGTVSLSRRGLPPPAREVASLLRRRGDVAFFQKGGLVLSVWRDKRVVATLSTNQDPRMVRPVDEGPIKPAPVVHYNRFMGGVDRSDQYRSYYAVGRASKKWWRYIVWFLLNLSIVNAWLLYRESPHEPPMPKNYDHFQFRVDLAEQLRGGHRRMGHHKGKRSRQVVSYVSAENMSAHRLVRTARGKKVCRLCSRHGRKTRAGRQVQTSFGCGICDVPLCRFGCFRDFHQAHA